MANRLTSTWTNTAEQAYGLTGKIGRIGELCLATFLIEKGYHVTDHEESYTKQLQGIDLTITNRSFKRPFTIDVKANLRTDGVFFIETSQRGWLYNQQKVSDCIWHINPTTLNMAWYSRNKMKCAISLLKERNFESLKSNGLLLLNIHSLPVELSFVRTIININKATKQPETHKYKHET
jgi:hypothetical protein